MKANLVLVVSLVVALSLMTFAAEAVNGMSVPTDIPVTAGVPVVIPVNVVDPSATMRSYRVTLVWDSTQLEFHAAHKNVDCVLGDITPGWAAPTINADPLYPGRLIIVGANGTAGSGSGCLLRITFTPLPGVTGGSFDLYDVTKLPPGPPTPGPSCAINGIASPGITVIDGSFVAATNTR